jgi:hypothetical protein
LFFDALESAQISGISWKAMRSRFFLPVVFGIIVLTLSWTCGALPRQGAERTVADGVYTTDQADRGVQLVVNYGCQNCHGTQMEGGAEEQPPLVGEQFVSAWSGRKLDELAAKIGTMPADRDAPYHVKPAEAPDIIASLLRANGYPEGKADLPADPNVLKRITIVEP